MKRILLDPVRRRKLFFFSPTLSHAHSFPFIWNVRMQMAPRVANAKRKKKGFRKRDRNGGRREDIHLPLPSSLGFHGQERTKEREHFLRTSRSGLFSSSASVVWGSEIVPWGFWARSNVDDRRPRLVTRPYEKSLTISTLTLKFKDEIWEADAVLACYSAQPPLISPQKRIFDMTTH